MSDILFYTHYGLLLLFGIVLSFSFAGVKGNKKYVFSLVNLFVVSITAQIILYISFGEHIVWQLYPLIAHLPIIIVLCAVYKKRLSTALASVSLSYLCCHPPKWFGMVVETLTDNYNAGYITRILLLIIVGLIAVFVLAPYIADIYNKDKRSIYMLGSTPVVYYIFDYITFIYTKMWFNNGLLVAEFLPSFLCVFFIFICVLFYKEHERTEDAKRKENLIQITVKQQARELEAIKKSNLEARILRHDMRHLLDNLATSIEQDDKETSLRLISGYITQVEAVAVHRFCRNDTINYVLANYVSKCEDADIDLSISISINELKTDDILLSSIISNALENAMNAQKELAEGERKISLTLKQANDKLLLSVKNPYNVKPVFVDDIPVAKQESHGYGTQSIRYITEKLGGKCQFTAQDNMFILRVII